MNNVGHIIVAATGIINGNYQEIVGDFIPATSGTYYVGIKGFMNGTPWYISLDDISIALSPTCINPTTLAASNITSSSVNSFPRFTNMLITVSR